MMAGLHLHYTEIRSQCVLDYLWTRTRWSDNVQIRNVFTLVFSMCMWTTSGYRSHVNTKCKRSHQVSVLNTCNIRILKFLKSSDLLINWMQLSTAHLKWYNTNWLIIWNYLSECIFYCNMLTFFPKNEAYGFLFYLWLYDWFLTGSRALATGQLDLTKACGGAERGVQEMWRLG